MARERVLFDPQQWPQDTYGGRGTENHIRYDQPTPPPEAFWVEALPFLLRKGKKVDTFAYWWLDLSPYDPSLKGWKLAGHGNMPLTTLNPKEKPRKGDIKLAHERSLDASWLDNYRPLGR